MTKKEFISLIVQDLVVDYPFGKELQKWSMKDFYIDANGEIKHNRIPLIMDVFIENARNPHQGQSTHGGGGVTPFDVSKSKPKFELEPEQKELFDDFEL